GVIFGLCPASPTTAQPLTGRRRGGGRFLGLVGRGFLQLAARTTAGTAARRQSRQAYCVLGVGHAGAGAIRSAAEARVRTAADRSATGSGGCGRRAIGHSG